MSFGNILCLVPCMIGMTEILVVVFVVLLLFGGKKVPELMKGLGQGVQSFKEGMNEPVKKETTNADNEVKLPEEIDSK